MATTNYHAVGGSHIAETTAGVRTDYLFDALGSTTCTVVASIAVNTYRFKPYGDALAKSGAGLDPQLMWLGRWGYRRSANENLYVRARHLNSMSANWLTRDSYWPDSPSGYVYADGNPISKFDPSGNVAIVIDAFIHRAASFERKHGKCTTLGGYESNSWIPTGGNSPDLLIGDDRDFEFNANRFRVMGIATVDNCSIGRLPTQGKFMSATGQRQIAMMSHGKTGDGACFDHQVTASYGPQRIINVFRNENVGRSVLEYEFIGAGSSNAYVWIGDQEIRVVARVTLTMHFASLAGERGARLDVKITGEHNAYPSFEGYATSEGNYNWLFKDMANGHYYPDAAKRNPMNGSTTLYVRPCKPSGDGTGHHDH